MRWMWRTQKEGHSAPRGARAWAPARKATLELLTLRTVTRYPPQATCLKHMYAGRGEPLLKTEAEERH